MTKPVIAVLACFASVSSVSAMRYLLPSRQIVFRGRQALGSWFGAMAEGSL
ncbi:MULTISPECIES: hypothetical protein [Xanthomonas translucens group]|jgi:hypothetical protein|uniref:Uncharacterized protein n=4 Tax=Xanthomonas translucens group TaxID=3390202 RepID=A0ABW9KRF4_XANCT|nr:hypothetical protein [Xanthomonas translucens]CTP83918.1 putative membrane protein [Xanthomonas translucens pv. arrhenatheri LMG 727]MCS3372559.1 hypothetical protein [Xanthomonas translucens pv. translucens]MCT8273409.1 hypothetical protein [Xanthomonas translucens pv. translucens]MCT8286258.1 hypothetical protein [Xanthomonas translucens pv. translucens]MCT8303916.1 hypothetical protein [Xanthomonas translucens pv. translucens]